MAIFCELNKKIKNIFINVNGEKKSVKSVWVNKDGVPTKVFQFNDETKQDPYEVAPENELSKWQHSLDSENRIVTLNRYSGKSIESDVVIYANYIVNGETYKTQLINYPNNYRPSKYLFESTNITSVKFSDNLDISNLTNTSYMFASCSYLVSVDFGHCFANNNITDMICMFRNCYVLENIKLSNFNTENVTKMDFMFEGCYYIQSLNLSSFSTKNVTSMAKMFYNALELQIIYVSQDKWIINSSCITDNMFYRCGTSGVTYI